jgi:hypothetical protein
MLTPSDLQMLTCSIKRGDRTPPETRNRYIKQINETLASFEASDTLSKSATETLELIRERGWLQTAAADCPRPSR